MLPWFRPFFRSLASAGLLAPAVELNGAPLKKLPQRKVDGAVVYVIPLDEEGAQRRGPHSHG